MAGKGMTETPVCVYQSQTPPLGERYLPPSSVGVSKHWIVLAEARSGKEKSGQGGYVAKDELEVEITSTICQDHSIPGKLSLSFLNYSWDYLSYY